VSKQDHELETHIDHTFIRDAAGALANGTPVSLTAEIRNTDRAIGTMLGHYLTKAHGEFGLEPEYHRHFTDGFCRPIPRRLRSAGNNSSARG